MTDKLKVFNNVVDVNSTAAVTEVTIASTGGTEQAVIKNVEFSASDTIYPITASLKHDNRSAYTALQVAAGKTVSSTLSGTQIVDSNSVYKLALDTGASKNYVPTVTALFMDGSANNTRYLSDSRTDFFSGVVTFAQVAPTISSATAVSASPAPDAHSAFGWREGSNLRFAAHYYQQSRVYNELGQLQYTTATVPSNVYGATVDDTYIYYISPNTSSTIYRRLRSDGTSASNLTTTSTMRGPNNNQGSFVLYYNGYLYSKYESADTIIYKINVTTGAVTQISHTDMNVSSYSVGAAVTVAADGTPYIIEHGSGSNCYALNLNTEQVTNLSGGYSMGVSTEYGNIALEVAPGIVWFGYNAEGKWVDANAMTKSTSNVPSSTFGLPNIQNSTQACSIANIPLHDAPANPIPRNTTYSLYADGVEITGV